MGRPRSNPDSPMRAARIAAGLSEAEAAAAITRCAATIARYETGKHTPPQAVLIELARLYNVAPAQLWPDPVVSRPAAIASDLVALGERLPPSERTELRRIVGDLAALVGDIHRLVPAHG